MHLSIILFSIVAVFGVRLGWRRFSKGEVSPSRGNWASRWQWALGVFLFPPLLLGMTALAVLMMGTEGYMLGLPVGWIGYLWALSYLGFIGVYFLVVLAGGWRSLKTVEEYRLFNFQETVGHILDSSALFAAQVGFWNSKLVVSRGLLETLSEEQIQAVLTHESAHSYYRDTFWFFGLGWLRQTTFWLPQSKALWQELLLLRELRADQWAAQRVDPLLLAESLLLVVKDTARQPEFNCAAFDAADRLEERIEALLTPSEQIDHGRYITFAWLFMAMLPFLTLLLHN
jgi:Zn-dependent protease with chaperone function